MNNHKFESAYIDESGDDGAKGSKYFVISLWCTSERKEISKIVRSTKQRLLAKNKTARWLNKKGGEIKYSGFPVLGFGLNFPSFIACFAFSDDQCQCLPELCL